MARALTYGGAAAAAGFALLWLAMLGITLFSIEAMWRLR